MAKDKMYGKKMCIRDSRYFVGYTPYYTAAVWIGYDRNASIRANGNPAAQLWKKAMSEAHENLPNQNRCV